jgi:mono/diheme cytochrome c family protein
MTVIRDATVDRGAARAPAGPPAAWTEGRMLERRGLAVLALAAAVGGCSGQGALSPEAERGRQVYVAQCTACHSSDPAQNGPLGPAVRGSTRELLEARLLRGTYPPGYVPKRPSAVMQPMPHLAGSLGDLAAYLR